MHNGDPGIGRAVDREILFGCGHRIKMAGLRRQVEQEVLTADPKPQGIAAVDIGNVDVHPIADISDIGKIAAIFGDHAVDQQNLDAERDETPRDGRADKVLTAGDRRPRAGIGFKARIRT